MYRNREWITLIISATVMLIHSEVFALDDPTRPPGYPLVTPKGQKGAAVMHWVVSAIRISPQERIAIINGRTAREGDRIDGAVVVEILPAEVRLRHKTKEFSVRLVTVRVKKQLRTVGQ